MKYILSEAEYNELVSAKQTLEKVVANLQDDLIGTQKTLDKATKKVLKLTLDLQHADGELQYYKSEYRHLLIEMSAKNREIFKRSRKPAVNEFGEVVR